MQRTIPIQRVSSLESSQSERGRKPKGRVLRALPRPARTNRGRRLASGLAVLVVVALAGLGLALQGGRPHASAKSEASSRCAGDSLRARMCELAHQGSLVSRLDY